jgi:hypothetical protein
VIRVLVLYDVDGWAYHNRALALQKYSPEGFDIRIAGMETSCANSRSIVGNSNDSAWVRSRLLEIFGEDPPEVILSLCSHLVKPVRRLGGGQQSRLF